MLAVLLLLLLHGGDGSEIRINPSKITSLREAKPGDDNKHFASTVHCMVSLTDGKYVAVIEPCEVVQKLLEK